MGDIITALQSTPLPTILVVGGIGLLFLAVAGGISGKIEVPRDRQIWAGIIGGALVLFGIALYAIPSAPTPADVSTMPGPAQLLETAKTWPLVLQDSFEDNGTGWWTGSEEDDLEIESREIAAGRYVWTMEAKQDDIYHWHVPPIDPISDFYLTVRVKNAPVAGEDAMYGLILRREGDNFYAFEIKDTQTFKFRLRYEGRWDELIDWTSSASIRPEEVNRITVIADGSQFWLYINDNYVGERSDERLRVGNVGLKVGLLRAGDKSIFEFDDFELRRRP